MLGVLGGGNVILFIKFLIERHDRKKEHEDENLKNRLEILEKDGLRTQLLLLILLNSGEQAEILRVAEHYFKDLQGNWYMTSIFNKWLESEAVASPEWFDTE